MPITISQHELARVVDLRATQKSLGKLVRELKDRFIQGARVERGPLQPEIRTSIRPDHSARALREILGERAYAELAASLPEREFQALYIVGKRKPSRRRANGPDDPADAFENLF